MKLWRHKEFWPWLVAAFALIVRVIYVFYCTAYRTYVVNDMRWYWERALEFSSGDFFSIHQWGVWPPFYHMAVGALIYLANFFVEVGHRIEIVLAIQMILGSATVYLVYRIARVVLANSEPQGSHSRHPEQREGSQESPEKILRSAQNDNTSEKWALGVAILYAIAYPLIFFNAFVLSENIAIPFLILAAWLVIEPNLEHRRWAIILSAVILVLAIGMRPAFMFFIFPFIWYLGQKSWKRTAVPFMVTAGLMFVALVGYTAFISGGQVVNTGANGGVNLFLRQCRVRYLQVEANNVNVVLSPAQFYGPDYDNLPSLHTSVPIFKQQYYINSAWNCFRGGGVIMLATNILELKRLFFGKSFFPWFPGAWGFRTFISIWTWWFFGVTVLGLVGGLRSKTRKSHAWPEIQFFLLLLLCVAITGIIFPVEPRFLYPLIFAIYVLAALAIKEITSSSHK